MLVLSMLRNETVDQKEVVEGAVGEVLYSMVRARLLMSQ